MKSVLSLFSVVAGTVGLVLAFLAGIASPTGPASAQSQRVTIRVGHFPNVTHVRRLLPGTLSDRD
jgi:hypothetical protein